MASYLSEDHREMIGVELDTPMIIGETYYVSFYAVAADGGIQPNGLRSNNLGVLFCMEPYSWLFGMPEFGLRNYAHTYSEVVISDIANWQLISGTFLADSAYRFMVVGNHFDNANTVTDTLETGFQLSYHLVDQFCVSSDPMGCPLAMGVANSGAMPISLYPNPAMDEVVVRGLTEDALASIYDALGRKVWHGRLTRQHYKLDVQAWPRGSYIMRVEGKEQFRSVKFVLTK